MRDPVCDARAPHGPHLKLSEKSRRCGLRRLVTLSAGNETKHSHAAGVVMVAGGGGVVSPL